MVQTIPPDVYATVILTRPQDASKGFWDAFCADVTGVEPIISPLLEIVPTGLTPDVTPYQGVIFSSANGVAYGGGAFDLPAFCVGDVTTQKARDLGWAAQTAGATSQDLVSALLDQAPKAPLLHIGGRHRRGDIAKKLTQSGILTHTVDVYDQRLCPLTDQAQSALRGERPVIVPLFSPRTAGQFAEQAEIQAPVHFVAISQAVLDEVAGLPYVSAHISEAPDAFSIRVTLQNVLRRVEADGTAQ